MRVMILLKSNAETESGTPPDQKILTEMGKFNEELVNAGIMLAGEGLHPTSDGVRVRFSGDRRAVVRGPFPDSTIAGYWLWQVDSLDEAIEWVKRCPNPTGQEGEIEIRPVWETDEIPAMTPELKRQEEELRARIEDQPQ